MDNQHNPYAAPVDASTLEPKLSEHDAPQEIRNGMYFWEANVRSLGGLLILLGFFPALPWLFGAPLWMVGALCVVSLLLFWVGHGLYALQPWAKFPAILTLILLLAYIPLGTVLSVIGLPFLLCRNGRLVLSEDFQSIVAATEKPSFQAGTIILGVGLVIVIAALAALFG